ncbi:sigma-70 family RNA polymerase sigma factor [Piscinibacter sakaiensis]|uniref:sigma-70 family RNA polymerase sigma factor n=1 Tax=Piscinibacter sakaiensis TaxID=1547922 RepID=UPI003AAD3791
MTTVQHATATRQPFPPALALALTNEPLAAAPAATEGSPVSWQEVISHRSYMVRFAQRKLRDPMLAEDVVHDVFEAVLSGRASFAGKSALRSWLTAILKHKIIDLVRQRAHYDGFDAVDDDGERGAQQIECPQPRPDEVFEQREALRNTLARIEALPATLREVVQLRVLLDQPTEQVCASLSISEDNLFVRLHRARRQLAS